MEPSEAASLIRRVGLEQLLEPAWERFQEAARPSTNTSRFDKKEVETMSVAFTRGKGFPGTKHDDQVDSTTQALDYLREPDLVATYVKAFSG